MDKERLKEALISLVIGILIAIFSTALDILKDMDPTSINNLISSAAGTIAYILQRVKHFV